MHGIWAKAKDADPDLMIERAVGAGVTRMVCVGTTVADSRLAVEFVLGRDGCWASVGVHPHEARVGDFGELADFFGLGEVSNTATDPSSSSQARRSRQGHDGLTSATDLVRAFEAEDGSVAADASSGGKIVAIGECGLDYFYGHSPREDQVRALRFQIELALEHGLPLIFHVREAFEDFWPIFDGYRGLRGVLHSFTDSRANLDKALERGLFIGLNGIMTFTKNEAQLGVAKSVPLQNLLLETDAPFLTPEPHRGTINEPARTRVVAEFLAKLRGESLVDLATETTKNARELFHL
jgi:TatD DNase family protein